MKRALLLLTLFLVGCGTATGPDVESVENRDRDRPTEETVEIIEESDRVGIGYDWGSMADQGFTRSNDPLIEADLNGNGEADLITGLHMQSTLIVVLDGETTFHQKDRGFGYSFASGDFNGDGYDDLAVGQAVEQSVVHVMLGGPDFDGSTSYTIEVEGDNHFGFDLDAGDLNGDSYDDLAVGAPGSPTDDSRGEVYSYFGSEDRLQQTHRVTSTRRYTKLGTRVKVSDVLDNGHEDLILSSMFYDGPKTSRGAVWVLEGDVSGTVEQVARVTFNGSHDEDQLAGFGVGDVNGDGERDVVLGARKHNHPDFYSNYMGKAYVIYGPFRGEYDVERDADVHLNPYERSSDNSNIGTFASGRFGQAIEVSDVNGDGTDDVAVGQFEKNRVYVLHGSADLPSDVLWNDYDQILTDEDGRHFGRALANVGGDLVVSDPAKSVNSNQYGELHFYTNL
jgi:hypothetical protein